MPFPRTLLYPSQQIPLLLPQEGSEEILLDIKPGVPNAASGRGTRLLSKCSAPSMASFQGLPILAITEILPLVLLYLVSPCQRQLGLWTCNLLLSLTNQILSSCEKLSGSCYRRL